MDSLSAGLWASCTDEQHTATMACGRTAELPPTPAPTVVRASAAPPGLPTRSECIAKAQMIFARAAAEAAWLYAEQGAMAVAEAAHEPGGPSVEEIAATYEALHARVVRQRAGAAGGLTSEQARASREEAVFRRLADDRALPDSYQEQ